MTGKWSKTVSEPSEPVGRLKQFVITGACLTSLLPGVLRAEHVPSVENTNYTIRTGATETADATWLNYNRLRVKDAWQRGAWFMTAIGDIEHYLGREFITGEGFERYRDRAPDTPFSTRTRQGEYGEGVYYAELYRLYGGYVDASHRVSFGLQKISMGVGRIWNPTDLFNPKNPLALEPDEVFGVFALSYTRTLGDLSELQVVAAEREDHTGKYAGRFKSSHELADVAVNGVEADDVRMVGYEIEGEWGRYGAGWRSEGGWFDDKVLNETFFQAIAGVDRAFSDDSVLTAEWLHSSKRFSADQIARGALQDTLKQGRDYAAVSGTYRFEPLLSGTLTGILNIDDSSCYLSPYLEYSLSDEAVVGLGAMLYGGGAGTEFGALGERVYLRVRMTF